MENKLNLVELLKDCPKGMELDCTICNGVKFVELDRNPNFPIVVRANNGYEFTLTKYGQVHNINDAKCVIFPKGKTTWEGFIPPCKFKDGDVLFVDCSDDEEDKLYQYIFILNEPEFNGKWHSYCYLNGVGDFDSKETYLTDDEYHPRFATEEEKQKLFQAIKDNGCKWNEEIKTLEIVPKFKVGDRIVHKVNKESPFIITEITNDCYKGGTQYEILIEQQDNFELVPNKFDITTLKPFDKVLVRDGAGFWRPSLFGKDMIVGYRYFTACGNYKECIPYENNEHLLGTRNDCDDFYKTWE